MSTTDIVSVTASTPVAKSGAQHKRGQLSRPLSLLLISPLLLLLGWTFFLPIGRLLLTSFTDPSLNFDNYARIFTEPLYVDVFVRTLWIAGTCTVLSLLVGYPIAMLIARPGRMSRIAMICVLVPLWTSVLI
ncbi:MAG: ABC transporter permease, partial [Rhizobiaceae bacterium]|nr:ABC transporter permease [Rhizobiaceae bacterium]